MTSTEKRIQQIVTFRKIGDDVYNILESHLLDVLVSLNITEDDVEQIHKDISDFVYGDLITLSEYDPAAKGYDYLINRSTFKAVMHYRIANIIYYYEGIKTPATRELIAHSISEVAKLSFGIDINPAAMIGEKFVLDHGQNTIIGETCVIGSNCYMLDNNILGVRKFGLRKSGKIVNKNKRRHPMLGHGVRLSGQTRLLGPITIGNNVHISPHSVITHDVPENSKVVIANQLQICRGKCDEREIYGVVPENNGIICIYGTGLQNSSVSFVENIKGAYETYDFIKVEMIEADTNKIRFKIVIDNKKSKSNCNLNNVQIWLQKDGCELILTNSRGLVKIFKSLVWN